MLQKSLISYEKHYLAPVEPLRMIGKRYPLKQQTSTFSLRHFRLRGLDEKKTARSKDSGNFLI